MNSGDGRIRDKITILISVVSEFLAGSFSR